MKYLTETVKELESIMNKEAFDVEPYSGGNATISVTDHSFQFVIEPVEGYHIAIDAVLNGEIKYVVSNYISYQDTPPEYDLTDGFFEGNMTIYSKSEEHEHFEDLLINLK